MQVEGSFQVASFLLSLAKMFTSTLLHCPIGAPTLANQTWASINPTSTSRFALVSRLTLYPLD